MKKRAYTNVYDRIDHIAEMARKLNRGCDQHGNLQWIRLFPKSVILKHLIISIEKDLLMVTKQLEESKCSKHWGGVND